MGNGELAYQNRISKRLGEMFEGCVILKNNPDEVQGIPDLLILHGPNWAMLEVKLHASAAHRPNQEYYVRLLNEMSFAAFIFPENEEQVLHELQYAFGLTR